MEHRDVSQGELHGIANWTAASAEDLAAISVTLADVGKVAYVEDVGYYTLRSVTPIVWEPFVPKCTIYATAAAAATAAASFTQADVGRTIAVASSRTFYYVYSVDPVVLLPLGLRTISDVDNIVANEAALSGITVTSDNLYSTAYTLDAKRLYVLTGVGPNVWSPVDAYAVQRSKHTGTQDASTVTYAGNTLTSKLQEWRTREDAGGTRRVLLDVMAGGARSDTWVTNPERNKAVANLSCAAIIGGGSDSDPHLLGYRYPTVRAAGSAVTCILDCVVVDSSLVNAFVRSSDYTQSTRTVVSGGITVTPNTPTGQTTVTFTPALSASEVAVVEYQDPNMLVAVGGILPSYGSVGGGAYDSQVWQGLMNHCAHTAHSRIENGSHGIIAGGSYHRILGGDYGALVGGTQNEIGTVTGYGSGSFGGLRNRIHGYTSSALGGQSNWLIGTYAASAGGKSIKIAGRATFGIGESVTHNGNWGAIGGQGSTFNGNYTVGFGYGQSNAAGHHYCFLTPGIEGRTRMPHNSVLYAVRDSTNSAGVMRQLDRVGLSVATTGTTSAYMLFDDGTESLEVPTGCVWNCVLRVSARSHAPRPAIFNVEFAAYLNSGAATVNVIETRSYVHSGHGTAGNAATITVSASGAGIKVLWQPRLDTAVPAEVAGVLEILEVAASP